MPPSMPGFERAATIDRPPSQVFAVLDDVQHCGRWMRAVRKVEVLTPTFAVDVGYRWRETRRVLGILRVRMELEIKEHDPPRRWGLEYNDGKTQAIATFTLEPVDGGTLVTLREDVVALDGNERRVARMARRIEKADANLLRDLKAYVETLPREEPAAATAAKKARTPKAAKAAATDGALDGAPKRKRARRRSPSKPKAARATAATPAATSATETPSNDPIPVKAD